MKPIVERVARWLYPTGSVRTVLRGPARGARYKVRPAMGAAFGVGRDGFHFAALQRMIAPGMCVFDVGANRGQSALMFARRVTPSGQVVSFEPVPELFDDLAENVRLNRFSHVRCERKAVAAARGTTTFSYSPANPTLGRIETANEAASTDLVVETISLDEYASESGLQPDFIKIDVEGGGQGVLQGARRLLEERRPRIYIELHNASEQLAVKEEIGRRSYRLMTLEREGVADPTAGWFSPLWCEPQSA